MNNALRVTLIGTPSSYVYSRMPPLFRWCRRFAQTLFVVEWGAFFVLFFMGLIAVPIVLIQGEARFLDSWMFPLMEPLLFTFLPLGFLCRWLRHTAKLLWHCPCCGQPSPTTPRTGGMRKCGRRSATIPSGRCGSGM